MNCRLILELAAAGPNTTTVDRLVNIDWALRDTLFFGVPGDVVELGCYQGHTSVLLQDILVEEGAVERQLHLYDSFEGLPSPSDHDGDHLGVGDCLAKAETGDFRSRTFMRVGSIALCLRYCPRS
jgi:O-methyltransferase